MVLTTKQKEDLHWSILSYLEENGLKASAAALADELHLKSEPDVEDRKSKHKGQLDKKWTAVLRLQRKVMDLEKTVQQLQEELQAFSSGAVQKRRAAGVYLPVAPYRLRLPGHKGAIVNIEMNAVFGQVISVSDDATVRVWEAESGQCERTLRGHTNSVTNVALHPSGRSMATCSADLCSKIWDLDTGECLKTLTGHEHTISGICYVDEVRIATASRDKTVRVWDLSTGYCVATLNGHEDWVRRVVSVGDGDRLVTCSTDKTIRVWSISQQRCLNVLYGHGHVVECIALAPPGISKKICEAFGLEHQEDDSARFCVSGSRDRNLMLWDLSTNQIVHTFKGHDNWVRGAVFHPSGEHLISVSDDKSIRVWELKTQRCSRTIDRAHEHFVTCVSIHPAGRALVTGSVDEHVQFWECQ